MGFTLGDTTAAELGLLLRPGTQSPGLPATRDRTLTIPGRPGEYDFGADLGPRLFTLDCLLYDAETPGQLQDRIRQLASHLIDPQGRPRTLPLIFEWEPDRVYFVRYAGQLPIHRLVTAGEVTLPLSAHDPFAYDATETDWAARIDPGGILEIAVSGNVESPIVLTLAPVEQLHAIDMGSAGPDAEVPTVTNPSISIGDKTIAYDGVLEPGDELVIDTDRFTATLAGENVLDVVTGDFPRLQPGDQIVSYEDDTSNTGADVRIRYKGRWI